MTERERRQAIEDMNPLIPIKAIEFIRKRYPENPTHENLENFRRIVARRFGVLKETATNWISAETT